MIFSQADPQRQKNKNTDESNHKKPLNVTIDEGNLQITVEGVPIDYKQQTLTPQGLQIIRGATDDAFSARILLEPKISIQFDTKFGELNYCQELAHALDRTSHSAAAIYRKAKLLKNKEFSPSSQYSLEICEFLVKKIPRKARCLQNVFANLPIDKIVVLFENNGFFVQVLKLIVFFVFKVDVEQIQNSQLNKQVLTVNLKSRENLEDVQNDSNSTSKKSKSRLKREKNFSSNFNIRVFNLYESLKENLNKYKLCFERLNLLKRLFSHETRLYTFLNDLSQTIIARELSQSVPQLHQYSEENILNSLFPKPNLVLDVLNKNIAIIKTVYLSLGRSETASKVIKQAFMENKAFSEWLKGNLQSISFSHDKSTKLIQLFGILSEICPIFMGSIFQQSQNIITTIIASEIRIIYQRINSQYQTETERQSEVQKSYSTLDTLLRICKLTIKQSSSSINMGRVICKVLCETATILRPSDIQLLTYSCCINTYSRQLLIRYLFSYFRRLVRKLKNSITPSRNALTSMSSLKQVRKHKHEVLEIIQSIRKIAELDCIDVEIGGEFVDDITMIVAHLQFRNVYHLNKKQGEETKEAKQSKSKLEIVDKTIKDRENCLTSALYSMLKKIKLQQTKQKDNKIADDTL